MSSTTPALSAAPPAGDDPLRGKVFIVTGGSRGLGAAVAQVLGEAGVRVVIADLALERAQDCAGKLGERGIEAIALPLDVGNEDQVQQVIATVRERLGRLDGVINNAAIDITAHRRADRRRLGTYPAHEPDRAVPAGQARRRGDGPKTAAGGGGHIVNIASTASKRAWPNASAYHASKRGLLGLSHALHAELRAAGHQGVGHRRRRRTPFLLDRFPDIDPGLLQDPMEVAKAVKFVLTQPDGTVIPELMVLPMRESSWP